MNIKNLLHDFKYFGFVNVGPILSTKEINELSKLSKKAFNEIRERSQGQVKHPDYISPDSAVEGLMYLPQQNKRIAQLIDKTLCNKLVFSVLKNVLGSSYKIWQITFRRSSPNDRGLYIHQDSPGETNICILLSSNKTGSGATVFLEGSHLVKNTMKKWKIELPPILLRWLSFLFTPITGDAGDVVFFFNRTWHGRMRNKSLHSYDVIFISFFPAGGIFGFEGYGFWAPKFLKSIKGTLLGRLIDPLIGTEILTNGQYKVINQKINPPTVLPYALKIHNKDYFEDSYGTKIKLTVKITLLRLLFFFVRPFYYLIKKNRR